MSDDTHEIRTSCGVGSGSIVDAARPHNEAEDSLTLTPLKTVLELRAENAVTDVYVTVVPVKSANPTLV